MLDTLGRSKPWNFAQYAFASTAIKIKWNGQPERLASMIMTTSYQTRRDPDFTRFFINAKKKVGTQAIWNRLHSITEVLGREWDKPKSKDQLRIHLKKNYF